MEKLDIRLWGALRAYVYGRLFFIFMPILEFIEYIGY